MVDILGFIIPFASIFGIYAILSTSLNLEYGYGGQPNFGQTLFYGLGAFVAGIVVANLLPMLAHVSFNSICDTSAYTQRGIIALNNPSFAISTWVLALFISMAITGVVGYLLAYPAARVKEEWYLAMILLVAGDMFVIIVRNTPQFGCGFNGVAGLINPFAWIGTQMTNANPSISTSLVNNITSGIYAAVILGFAALCFFIAERIAKSPYGRLLKSIRDDYTAAESLGKDVNKLRKQIMLIGSIMAGLAGALYVFYIGVATTEDYVSTVTFSLWVMMVLGGFANNRGVLVGTFVITLLDRGSLLLGILLQASIFNFNANLLIYVRYMAEAVILILLLMFRPKGLLPEKPVRTKAYDVFDFGKKDDSKGGPK